MSDTDRSVGAAFGVARSEGDKFAPYARRMSFLIDPDGVIRRVYDVYDVATHADEVLDDLGRLVR